MASWREIGVNNYRDAELMESTKSYRSATSRYYYAAFSVITHELRQRGAAAVFAANRETPTHAQIANLVDQFFTQFTPQRRTNFVREITALYRSRLEADYLSQQMDRQSASDAHQTAERIFRYLGVDK